MRRANLKFFTGLIILLSIGAAAPASAWPYNPYPWPDPAFAWGPPGPPGPVLLVAPEPPGPQVIYVTPPAPRQWIEKGPQYRYYCPEPAGYYPAVSRCPKGWLKVAGQSGQ
ncbi:hypothetical protein FCN80_08405 [Martelella alba]|uniref:Lectin-like protein BA14k n=2 Tax=Martelella alba TaxID=2590451 RepID=A0ABY2SPE4_9HYPH|nr:hypothetical protein FCN80_08405 [Martelella alba]